MKRSVRNIGDGWIFLNADLYEIWLRGYGWRQTSTGVRHSPIALLEKRDTKLENFVFQLVKRARRIRFRCWRLEKWNKGHFFFFFNNSNYYWNLNFRRTWQFWKLKVFKVFYRFFEKKEQTLNIFIFFLNVLKSISAK